MSDKGKWTGEDDTRERFFHDTGMTPEDAYEKVYSTLTKAENAYMLRNLAAAEDSMRRAAASARDEDEAATFSGIADAISSGNVMTLTVGELILVANDVGLWPVVTMMPLDKAASSIFANAHAPV